MQLSKHRLIQFGRDWAAGARAKSHQLVVRLPGMIERGAPWWIGVVVAIALAKVATAPIPVRSFGEFADIFLIYGLLILSPICAWRLTNAAFPRQHSIEQPQYRFAFIGRWTRLSSDEAKRHPLFGPTGLMASLLIGMLLNVPVRSAEFIVAVPAMHSAVPEWGRMIFLSMAFDAIAMNFLYAMCFVMALRSVPLFPRMLLAVWMIDVMMQMAIAGAVSASPGLPSQVAGPLVTLLDGNLNKVLISAAIWLPYLILSERVNVTYRNRVSRGGGHLLAQD